MTRVKKGDFIEVDYIGRVTGTGVIFDLTDEKIAKEQHVHREKAQYGPVIICVGEIQILPGIDENLVGKEIGKSYTINLTPDNAFGKKDAQLIKIVPLSVFHKQNIQVFPGMQVAVDQLFGIVRVVSGGRVIVDFNHPLAGKEVYYEITLLRIIEDKQEQIKSFFKFLGINVESQIEGNKVALSFDQKLPEQIKKELETRIKRLVKVEEVEFKTTTRA